MKPEHIRITPEEKIYGEKQLLYSQLELISFLKRYESFRNLRNEELLLKIALKNKIEETKKSIEVLNRLLPRPSLLPKEKEHHQKKTQTEIKKPKHLSLEGEVDEIQRKLKRLQGFNS